MNALAKPELDLLVSTDSAMAHAGDRVKAIVRGLQIRGVHPRRFCSVEVRDRRLFALLTFDGAEQELAIPLDIWLRSAAG